MSAEFSPTTGSRRCGGADIVAFETGVLAQQLVLGQAAGGTDTEDNGLALCSLHHKALDRGAIGLDGDRRILVSQHVRGGHGVGEWLLRFVGQPVRPPQAGEPPPAEGNMGWHRREVFRAPPRAAG